MASSFDVAVVGAGPVAFDAVELLAKKAKKTKVAFIFGYTFREFGMAAAIFLNNPAEHEKWVCGVPEKWKAKWENVQYFLSSVETIDCDKKEIKLMEKGPDAGKVISYKAVILATGSKSPLMTQNLGCLCQNVSRNFRLVARPSRAQRP